MATAPILFNGSNLIVYIGTGSTATPIAMSRSCSISLAGTSVDSTTKDSTGGWAESIQVGRNWSANVEGLVVWGSDVTQFTSAIFDRKLLDLQLKRSDGLTGSIILSGSAWVESYEISASQDEAVTYSVSFTGCGELKQTLKA